MQQMTNDRNAKVQINLAEKSDDTNQSQRLGIFNSQLNARQQDHKSMAKQLYKQELDQQI